MRTEAINISIQVKVSTPSFVYQISFNIVKKQTNEKLLRVHLPF